MANDSSQVKNKTEVEITFLNGSSMRGNFFSAVTQRVVDLLNDTREFIPFEDIGGNIRLIRKANIRDVQPSEQDNGGRNNKSEFVYYVA
ncbi:MAG: hypothetical protein OEX83_09975 [Gammaproteobacteria bacterium]|nr:hypothetical protein [Gammaproteobacteria bacterium]